MNLYLSGLYVRHVLVLANEELINREKIFLLVNILYFELQAKDDYNLLILGNILH